MTLLASTLLGSVVWDVVVPVAIAALAAAWLVRRAWMTFSGKGAGCECPSAKTGKGCVKTDEMSRAVRSAMRKTSTPR